MKLMKLLFVFVLIANVQAYTSENKTQHKNKGRKMGNNSSILTNKPSFNLRIKCNSARVLIHLNGVEQFNSKRVAPVSLDLPVNDLITSGENKLEVLMLGVGTLPIDAQCNVTLFVRKFGDFDSPEQDILTVSYQHDQKEKLAGSTTIGKYSSLNSFKKDKDGDVEVSIVSVDTFKNMPLSGSDGVVVSAEFSLPTPFPRWKFLDAPKVLNKIYYSLTIQEAKQLQKENSQLKKLYSLNHRIYNAAKNKDIDTLISFFSERNREMDIAYFKVKGDTEKELRAEFKKDMEDKEQALREITESAWEQHKSTFVVEYGNTLAYLKAILVWNSIGYSGSASYNMKFRYDGEKWILTR